VDTRASVGDILCHDRGLREETGRTLWGSGWCLSWRIRKPL